GNPGASLGNPLLPTCLSDCEPQRNASGMRAQTRSRTAVDVARDAMGPLCGRIGWGRGPACYAGGARRMDGMGEVGARVRVDKLKPWNYSVKLPFPPNPRWLRLVGRRGSKSLKALLRLVRAGLRGVSMSANRGRAREDRESAS